MRSRGRPILGLISGFFAGLFLATSLLFYGVIPLDSALMVILPIGLMLFAFAMAMWFPIRRKARAK